MLDAALIGQLPSASAFEPGVGKRLETKSLKKQHFSIVCSNPTTLKNEMVQNSGSRKALKKLK